jgi:Transposase DDE domain
MLCVLAIWTVRPGFDASARGNCCPTFDRERLLSKMAAPVPCGICGFRVRRIPSGRRNVKSAPHQRDKTLTTGDWRTKNQPFPVWPDRTASRSLGQVSDATQFATSLDIGPDITPRVGITDKGYDSRANRAAARARGITPVIPRKTNSKERGRFFPKKLYKLGRASSRP